MNINPILSVNKWVIKELLVPVVSIFNHPKALLVNALALIIITKLTRDSFNHKLNNRQFFIGLLMLSVSFVIMNTVTVFDENKEGKFYKPCTKSIINNCATSFPPITAVMQYKNFAGSTTKSYQE